MNFAGDSVDDLIQKSVPFVLKSSTHLEWSKGWGRERSFVTFRLRNPLARISMSDSRGVLFSALGELLWYMSGSDDARVMDHYIPQYSSWTADDGCTSAGAYGPRLFPPQAAGQLDNIVSILRRRPHSRQAVVQLFHATDVVQPKQKDVPCTCVIQFLFRNGALHAQTYMRSNDLFRGFPHDVFAFTLIQEMVARRLQVQLGDYRHTVGSLHIYDKDSQNAWEYLAEGSQQTRAMPPMPTSDPTAGLQQLLQAEAALRLGTPWNTPPGVLPYWADLIRVLRFFAVTKQTTDAAVITAEANRIRSRMASSAYDVFIRRREFRKAAQRRRKNPLLIEPLDKGAHNGPS